MAVLAFSLLLGASGLTPAPGARARAASPGAPGCVRLSLGAPAWAYPLPVRPPAVLDLRPGGRTASAAEPAGRLAPADTLLAAWESPAADSIAVSWSPGYLGGSLELRLARAGDAWRGRYAAFRHGVSDGRVLSRGAALAVPVHCAGGRVADDSAARAAAARLARWRAADHPDTAAAVAEALAEFRAFLRRTPIHTLTLMNERLATYACLHGGLPPTLAALRARPRADAAAGPAYAALDAAEFRDAWGHAPRYRPTPPGYEVRVAGPDGIFGTADDLVSAQERPPSRDRSAGCR